MIEERLKSILRTSGRTQLEDALHISGTKLVYCASESSLKSNLPPDGSGLVVITDADNMLAYLKDLNVYKEERIFSVRSESMETVEGILAHSKPTVVMGFGGGRVLDIAKMVAFRASVPLILTPTTPTHDGLLSRNCALIVDGKKNSYPTKYAVKTLIPEYLWVSSGERQKAGRLDVLSNIVALQDVSLAMVEKGFAPDSRYMSMATEAVLRELHEDNQDDLAEALFFSGLAMHDSSRYCSGSEHEIEKLLMPFLSNGYFHGQLVGTGTLLAALIYQQNASKLPQNLFFDPYVLYDDLVRIFREKELLEYVLRPLIEHPAHEIAEVLKGASSVRPDRYTIWNKISSENIDWKQVIGTVAALRASKVSSYQ